LQRKRAPGKITGGVNSFTEMGVRKELAVFCLVYNPFGKLRAGWSAW
jgi:hypothetical protein